MQNVIASHVYPASRISQRGCMRWLLWTDTEIVFMHRALLGDANGNVVLPPSRCAENEFPAAVPHAAAV